MGTRAMSAAGTGASAIGASAMPPMGRSAMGWSAVGTLAARRSEVGGPASDPLSVAETKFDARIRPEVTMLRASTPYPKRRAQIERTAGPAATASDQPSISGRQVSGQPVSAPVGERVSPMPEHDAQVAELCIHARADKSSPIRLTRRGRVVLGALIGVTVAAVAVVLWLAIGGPAQASSDMHSGQQDGHPLLRVVVQPGQTLWNIAVRADPSADPRIVIAQIIDDNALRGTSIEAGQVLWVPRA